jgi:hypothetical protein
MTPLISCPRCGARFLSDRALAEHEAICAAAPFTRALVALHERRGCSGCVYVDQDKWGRKDCCTYAGDIKTVEESGRCLTHRRPDPWENHEWRSLTQPRSGKSPEQTLEEEMIMTDKKATKKTTPAEVPAAAAAATPAAPAAPRAPRAAHAKSAMSVFDAAAKVLADAGKPMNAQEIAQAAIGKGYWSTNGKTPHATVHAALSREIKTAGDKSRFKRAGRGMFATNG